MAEYLVRRSGVGVVEHQNYRNPETLQDMPRTIKLKELLRSRRAYSRQFEYPSKGIIRPCHYILLGRVEELSGL